ncbi:NapC/NirT family cytochrome c [Fontisphaera persica]|uniref:cytochrome c3 family protein n=1 Tax=Fontisphaera persica TaxID=2974023 RepID=UPI0024BF4B0C|nr:NapC/NirT family cytochrome c [Fontisphaera persica]WCJ58861.1 NapC/NirT family cytochrome c [Fontisphaera persica]
MAEQPQRETAPNPLLHRNWLLVAGLIIMAGSLFSFLMLFVMHGMKGGSNAYVGILTFFVAPAFLFLGLGLAVLGVWWRRRQIMKGGGPAPRLQFDLSMARDRRVVLVGIGGLLAFLLISALGSYQTYHFTESTVFCGQACHQVMEPEMTAYQNGPHARVSCTECHIGPGAEWFVKSKLSGSYQVYATLANKYPRPIPTPIKDLRPAQETCEQCHWPAKFVGNTDRLYTYYLGDETNTVHHLRLLLKVGGADPTHGPVGGIHWHMNVGHIVEYVPADDSRMVIPYVRLTDMQGRVTEFHLPGYTNKVDRSRMRRMDCVDCHNRPAHIFKAPNDAVNLAMSLGQIDPGLPWIKTNALYILTQNYQTAEEATQKIAQFIRAKYPGHPKAEAAVVALQEIYRRNFFPGMKVNWRAYPNHIGHKDWPGCTRCHDDKHVSADGKKKIVFKDCSICHIILAQGDGAKLEQLNARGQPFEHPGDEIPSGYQCHECHNGGPM